MSLDEKQRKQVVNTWLTDKLTEYENGMLEHGPVDEETKDDMVCTQQMLLSDARERLYLQKFDYVKDDTAEALRKAGLPEELANDRRLLRDMLGAHVELEQRHLGQLLAGTIEGDSCNPQPLPPARLAPNTPEEPLQAPRPTEELIAEFLKEKSTDIRGRSLHDYHTSYNVLLELLDGKPLAELKRQGAIDLKFELLDYPVNRSKGQNAGLTLAQIKELDGWRTISNTTANKHYTRWSTLASWCSEWDYVSKNYLAGLAPEADEETRRAWSHDELEAIFSALQGRTFKQEALWQYWLPILGLTRGARIEELSGLKVSDVTNAEAQCWYLNVDHNEYRLLKNKRSRRRIPLHPWLVENGFLEFARDQGTELLFPDLKRYSSSKLGHEPSKWFGRFKTELGYGKEVAFHSFRHTMRNMLTDIRAQDSHIKAMLGHDQGDVTFKKYGDAFKPDTLKPHIDQLPVSQYLSLIPHYNNLLKP